MERFDFEIKSTTAVDLMSVEEKIQYFNEIKEYVLSLPYDMKQLEQGEKKFLKTLDHFVPKVIKLYRPNIYSKTMAIPKSPFILVSNHLGSFDQVLLSCGFPKTAFHYMIAESLMQKQNLCVGKLYQARGAFVVDRKSPEGRRLAIPKSLEYIYRGRNVAILPEGTRTILYGSDGTVQNFKNGAVTLAQMANVPIVPVAINNNFKKGESFINIGNEFRVGIEDNIHEKNEELREKVIDLWNENKSNGAIILTKKK